MTYKNPSAKAEDMTDDPANGPFSQTLANLLSEVTEESTTLSTIVRLMGNGSIGSLLLFFALPMALPIPAPGLSILFGIPLMLISAQLLFGRTSLWLPKMLAEREVPRKTLEAYVTKATPLLEKVERFLKPRYDAATRGPMLRLMGAVSLILSAIITLPVPFGNVVPGAAISLMALGLIQRDGAAIMAGLVTALVALGVILLAISGLAALGNALF